MSYVLVPGKRCGGYSPCMRYWYVEFDFLPSRPPYAHGCGCQVVEMEDSELPHGRTMAECEYIELMSPAEWEALFGRIRANLVINKELTVADLVGPRGGPVPDLAELGFCQSGKHLTPEQHAMAKADAASRAQSHSHSMPMHDEIITEEDVSSGWNVVDDEKSKPAEHQEPSHESWWDRLIHRRDTPRED